MDASDIFIAENDGNFDFWIQANAVLWTLAGTDNPQANLKNTMFSRGNHISYQDNIALRTLWFSG